MTITSFNRWLDISHCCFPIKKTPPRWTNIAMDKYCKKSPSLIDTPVRRSPYSMGQVAKFHGADSQRLSISILYIPIGEIPLFEALEPTGTAVILPSGMDKPHWWTLIESPWGSRIRGFQEFLQPELNKKAATTYWKTYILDGFIHGYSCSLSLSIYMFIDVSLKISDSCGIYPTASIMSLSNKMLDLPPMRRDFIGKRDFNAGTWSKTYWKIRLSSNNNC